MTSAAAPMEVVQPDHVHLAAPMRGPHGWVDGRVGDEEEPAPGDVEVVALAHELSGPPEPSHVLRPHVPGPVAGGRRPSLRPIAALAVPDGRSLPPHRRRRTRDDHRATTERTRWATSEALRHVG